MSEYQYYEFQAIDRPLDRAEMAELRSITSRATITPASLVNVYHFGDFKGNPARLMERYFDAHLYTANWGTNRLMLRLPIASFPLESAEPYLAERGLGASATATHVILDFHSNLDGGDDEFDGGEGWLASLLPIRSGLMAGDLRALYLAWLGAVLAGEVDEEEEEPLVPPGLGKLSAPLRRLCDFLRVDTALVDIAAESSARESPDEFPAGKLAGWVAGLDPAEKDALLVRLMQGEAVGGGLMARFRKENRPKGEAGPARRKAGDLLRALERVQDEEKRLAAERAAREAERRAREQAELRRRELGSLAGRQEAAWHEAEASIARKQAKEYDAAVELLGKLREVAAREGKGEAFAARLAELRTRHAGKRTLIERLDKAGL